MENPTSSRFPTVGSAVWLKRATPNTMQNHFRTPMLVIFSARSLLSPTFFIQVDDSNTRFEATPAEASGGKHPWSGSLAELFSLESSSNYLSMFSSCPMPFAHMETTRSNTTASVCTCPPLLASCMDFPLLRAFKPRATPCQGRGGGAQEEELWENTRGLSNT